MAGIRALDDDVAAVSPPSWRSLRQDARRCENALNAALSDHGRVGTELAALRRAGPRADSVDALRRRAEAADAAVRRVIEELDETAAAMGETLALGENASDEGMAATVQRYVAILRDSRADFRRSSRSLAAALQQAELMLGRSAGGSGRVRSQAELLMEEKGGIDRSQAAAAAMLESAESSHDALVRQRGLFAQIEGKLGDVGGAFPAVNELIGKISRHKNRDNIVLSCVIATCMFFTLFYSMTRQ